MLSLTVFEQNNDAATHADADEVQRNEYEEDRDNESDSGPSRRVNDVWPGAPCDNSILVPPGWRCDESGIWSPEGNLFPEKVVIVGILEDIEGHTFEVELACQDGAPWIHMTCPKGQTASPSSIIKLANRGLPVNSRNASILVEFLSAFERCNRENLPRTRLAKRCGWHEPGEFLCGHEVIGGSGDGSPLRFVGDDRGGDQIVAGIRRGGTMEGWLEAIALLANAPRAQLVLYAGLAPPLLEIIFALNFIFSLAGRTSTGKTTAQMVTASAWGYPVPNGPEGPSLVFSWNGTPISRERTAAILCGVPFILDDTKSVPPKDRSDITSTVYQFANGSGRGRGSQTGLAATRSWQSVLIASGEEPITSFSNDGGTRARTLSMWGSPFPQGPHTGQMVAALRDQLADHFGHAGPQVVEFLAAHREQWPELRKTHRQLRLKYEKRAGGNDVARRLAAHLATLEMTAILAHKALALPWEYVNVVEELWPELMAGADDADQAAVALVRFHSWATNNRGRFADGTAGETTSSPLLGLWNWTGQDPQDPCLLIFPHQLDAAIKQLQYTPEGIRKQWNERGWLRSESRKTTLRVKINGEPRCPMVAIRWSAINQLDDGDPSEAPD